MELQQAFKELYECEYPEDVSRASKNTLCVAVKSRGVARLKAQYKIYLKRYARITGDSNG